MATKKEDRKAWGLCESCSNFIPPNSCKNQDTSQKDTVVFRESWPGFFDGDRCVKCFKYLNSSEEYQ